MSRYIDGEAALNAIKDYEVDAPEYMGGWACKLVYAVKGDIYGLVKEIPTVDAVPVVHGKWIHMEVSSGRDSWRCSICGRRARGKIENLPFCHCGAKMDEVTE